MEDEVVRTVEQSGLPIYVLPDAQRRHISEYGTHGFAIRHEAGTRLVDVGVLRKGSREAGTGPIVRTDITDTLATRLLLARYQDVPQGTDSAEWFMSVERDARRAGPWEPIDIEVDGRRRRFLRLEAGGHWVAFVDLGEAWLYVHSVGPSPGESMRRVNSNELAMWLS
jgi:hypothetical protein